MVRHPDGRIFFVPGAWPGDEGVFRVRELRKNYGFAELVEISKPSLDRVSSPCLIQGFGAGSCGGCPWMMGSYSSQLRHKGSRLEVALHRAGLKTSKTKILPIQPSSENLAYRNRAQFKFDGRGIGFFSSASHQLCPTEKCLVLNEAMQKHLEKLWEEFRAGNLAPLPEGQTYSLYEIDDEQVLGNYSSGERRPFKQANESQNIYMRQWLGSRLPRAGEASSVVELFCGSGNFTSVVVEAGFKKIVAVEFSQAALQNLRAQAWPSVLPEARDLRDARNYDRLVAAHPKAEILILDPTREGAAGVERLARGLRFLSDIFYISCDLETFVRDAKKLTAEGFSLVEAQAVDLSPHTSHLEILSHFARDNAKFMTP